MLQIIHDKAKGWIAYAIVGLITVPFALFGINQYFDGGSKLVAATVNGEDVPVQSVQEALLRMKQQFGGRLPAGMDESALKQTALDSVINQVLMQQKIKDGHYRASNQEIAQTIAGIEAFQKDGQFDKTTYENALKMQRRDPAEFETLVRDDLSNQQLRQAVLQTAFLPKADAELYQSLRQQQRDIAVFTLKTTDFATQAQVTDADISQYYDANKAQFMTEEKVKLAFIDLKHDDLAAKVTVDEASLKKWFDDNATHYVTPEARMVSHILVEITDPSKDADAKKRIDALYADLKANKRSFEDIAKTDSDDKTAAEKNGSLGSVVAGDWGPEFEKAVFALKAGETSEPVKTESGYEIIRVTEIKPAVDKTFEQAKAEVEADYRKDQADKAFSEKADEIQKLAYENEGALDPVAAAVGLTVQQSDWISANQGAGIAMNAKVRAAAFSDDVKAGKNSDLLEVSETEAVVLRVVNHEDAKQKPLADVKDAIRQTLVAQKSRELVAQKGEAALKAVIAKQSWAGLADAGVGSETNVQKLGFVGRQDSSKLATEALDKAFAAAQPASGKVSWSGTGLANGDYVVIGVNAVKAGDSKLAADANDTASQGTAMRELAAMLEGWRETAKIEMHPENL